MNDTTRRAVLATAAGATALAAMPDLATAAPIKRAGKPGEFDWLTGEWRIANRQKQKDGSWIEFPGEATCWSILKGVGHVEELRIPTRDFSGMGLRLLDLEMGVWSDFWVNAKSGTLGAAGLTGGFVNGDGVFETVDEADKAKVYRGLWDRIVPGKSHRWTQAASRDGGRSWDVNWEMLWTRT